uniref:Uncharacterized protein n=1 Tax=Peronospora matthiolae TaxID=2874970 RepID=A0AAV1VNA6_9STRA
MQTRAASEEVPAAVLRRLHWTGLMLTLQDGSSAKLDDAGLLPVLTLGDECLHGGRFLVACLAACVIDVRQASTE